MNIVNVLKLRSVDANLVPKFMDNLYSCIDFKVTRYELLKTDEQLETIVNEDGYVAVQFQGIAYMIFFTQLNGKQYNILISKKELKSDLDKNIVKNVKMFYMNIPYVNKKYYNGSILDGKITKFGKTSNQFVIHELYYRPYMNMDLIKKHDIIKEEILPSFSKIEEIDFMMARLYKYEDLPSVLFEKLPKSQSRVIGLMFLSKVTKPYYVYTNEIELNTIKVKKEIPNTKVYENSLTEFKMVPTKNTDVYNLYDLDDGDEIGLAYIPNIRTSHYFANLFKRESEIKVQCIKSEKFNKWIPICNDTFDFSVDAL